VVRRRLSHVVLAALLAGSAAAFLHTEQLKVRRAAVGVPHVRQSFSPGCEPAAHCRRVARLSFALRRHETVEVSVIDAAGKPVRTLLHATRRPGVIRLTWDGTDDAGVRVRDGLYRLSVRLGGAGRTVVIPNVITVDTVAPRIRVTEVRRPAGGRVDARVHPTEPVRLYLAVLTAPAHGRGHLVPGTLERVRRNHVRWRPRSLPPGRYVLEIVGSDAAGNALVKPARIRITVP
jgi:hypothetical protein